MTYESLVYTVTVVKKRVDLEQLTKHCTKKNNCYDYFNKSNSLIIIKKIKQ